MDGCPFETFFSFSLGSMDGCAMCYMFSASPLGPWMLVSFGAKLEVLKSMCRREVSIAVAAAVEVSAALAPCSSSATFGPVSSSAAIVPGSFSAAVSPGQLCVALLHIHDEASLRLRSGADTDLGAPSRSRSSKVHQHCMTIHLQDQPKVSWLVELAPLGDKGAKVLANALHRALLPVAATVGAEFAAASPATRPWFVHILVGDGVSTNEAAAKILLAWVRARPLPHGLR